MTGWYCERPAEDCCRATACPLATTATKTLKAVATRRKGRRTRETRNAQNKLLIYLAGVIADTK